MMRFLIFFLIGFCSRGLLLAQKARRVEISRIETRIKEADTVFILNFWATTCPPCIAELPDFNRIDSAWKHKPVKVLLLSLDYAEAYPDKLNSFLSGKQLNPEVYWLSQTDSNELIPKISSGWSGAIPATFISYQKGKYTEFREEKITFEFLDDRIRSILNK